MDRQAGNINDSLINGDVFVNKIVDEIIQVYNGHYEQSESEDSSYTILRSSMKSVDKRLQYWKNMLHHRRILQRRLFHIKDECQEDISLDIDYHKHLYNRRFLDHAECNFTPSLCTAGSIKKLKNAMEMRGNATSKSEGKGPDFNNLEVIGRNRWHSTFFGYQSVHTISTLSTSAESMNMIVNVPQSLPDPSIVQKGTMTTTLSVLINGTSYCRHRPEYSPILERMFVCNPFEKSLRTIMRIENNGQRVLTFNWERSEFFAYNNTLFNTEEEVFVFDTEPFQLRSGEVREVLVLFRPSKVGITKQRWLLTTKPRIFFRCPMALTLNMHGRCRPPQEYLELMEYQMKVPIRFCRQLSVIQVHLKSPIRP